MGGGGGGRGGWWGGGGGGWGGGRRFGWWVGGCGGSLGFVGVGLLELDSVVARQAIQGMQTVHPELKVRGFQAESLPTGHWTA